MCGVWTEQIISQPQVIAKSSRLLQPVFESSLGERYNVLHAKPNLRNLHRLRARAN